ncbi:hypothetical protein AK830_g3255 [Neonectria ditissima]|uniref:DUF6594 domain-containing protein n=1 Tax=Neonectria ditissima TaxID=78410 RepID=A0A0P7BCD2_9HYPO|nr:hypothetical protein AK830_g3255 [Neonectria ditissima]
MDVENITERGGFPALAHRIAIHPDYETFVFRKFDRLSARNLLHLESRLAYLEWKLDQADEQAALDPDNETLRSIHVWEACEENAKDTARPEHRRMRIAEEVRETLKEYQEALLRQNQIAALKGPKKRALDVARGQSYNYIYDPLGNKKRRRPILGGLAEKRLDECNHGDLIGVRRPVDKDLFSRFLQDHWMFKTTIITDETEHIKENHVAWVAATVSTVVAAILLLGAIVLLRLLDEENAQLGVIAMFTVLFAASVGILTNARRAEIFASTAAYAAVLVVFVSSPPSNPGTGICTCVTTPAIPLHLKKENPHNPDQGQRPCRHNRAQHRTGRVVIGGRTRTTSCRLRSTRFIRLSRTRLLARGGARLGQRQTQRALLVQGEHVARVVSSLHGRTREAQLRRHLGDRRRGGRALGEGLRHRLGHGPRKLGLARRLPRSQPAILPGVRRRRRGRLVREPAVLAELERGVLAVGHRHGLAAEAGRLVLLVGHHLGDDVGADNDGGAAPGRRHRPRLVRAPRAVPVGAAVGDVGAALVVAAGGVAVAGAVVAAPLRVGVVAVSRRAALLRGAARPHDAVALAARLRVRVVALGAAAALLARRAAVAAADALVAVRAQQPSSTQLYPFLQHVPSPQESGGYIVSAALAELSGSSREEWEGGSLTVSGVAALPHRESGKSSVLQISDGTEVGAAFEGHKLCLCNVDEGLLRGLLQAQA